MDFCRNLFYIYSNIIFTPYHPCTYFEFHIPPITQGGVVEDRAENEKSVSIIEPQRQFTQELTTSIPPIDNTPSNQQSNGTTNLSIVAPPPTHVSRNTSNNTVVATKASTVQEDYERAVQLERREAKAAAKMNAIKHQVNNAGTFIAYILSNRSSLSLIHTNTRVLPPTLRPSLVVGPIVCKLYTVLIWPNRILRGRRGSWQKHR